MTDQSAVSTTPSADDTRAMALIDKANPFSILNLVTPQFEKAVHAAIAAKPEYFEMDERSLYKKLVHDGYRPSPMDNRLRHNFWGEYDRAVSAPSGAGRYINLQTVIARMCYDEFFYKYYIVHAYKIAWLLTPPASYMVKSEEALEFGLEQLRDILEHDHVGLGGRVDTKLAELKLKIFSLLDLRVKGAIVQKSMNVNVNATNKKVANLSTDATMQELEAELEKLRKRERASRNLPETQVNVSRIDDAEIVPDA